MTKYDTWKQNENNTATNLAQRTGIITGRRRLLLFPYAHDDKLDKINGLVAFVACGPSFAAQKMLHCNMLSFNLAGMIVSVDLPTAARVITAYSIFIKECPFFEIYRAVESNFTFNVRNKKDSLECEICQTNVSITEKSSDNNNNKLIVIKSTQLARSVFGCIPSAA